MPHASLVVCAKTCRSWKKKAESRLFNHIAFFPAREEHSRVQKPSFELYGQFRYSLPEHRYLWLWPCALHRSHIAHHTSCDGSRCLPIRRERPSHQLFCELARIVHENPSPKVHTSSLDLANHKRARLHRHNRDLDWVSFLTFHDGHFFAFTGDVNIFKASALTLTVDCRSSPLTPRGPVYLDRLTALKCRLPFTYGAQEITLILRDARRECSDISTPLEKCSCCHGNYNNLSLLPVPNLSRCGPLYIPILLAAYPSGVKSVTIVGAEQFVSAVAQPTTLQLLRNGFAEARDLFGLQHPHKDMLRLRSHNEYKAEVGEARYRMLTIR